MLHSKSAIHWAILLIIAGGIGGFFYFTYLDPGVVEESANLGIKSMKLPKNIKIINKNDKEILQDNDNSIEVVLDSYEILNPTNYVTFSFKDSDIEGELNPSFSLLRNDIRDTQIENAFTKWLNLNNKYCNNCYEFVGFEDLDGFNFSIVRDKYALGSRLDYLFIKNSYLYDLSLNNIEDKEKIREILKSIVFTGE